MKMKIGILYRSNIIERALFKAKVRNFVPLVILVLILIISRIFPYFIGTAHFEANRPSFTDDTKALIYGTKDFFSLYSPAYSTFLFLLFKVFGSYEISFHFLQHILGIIFAIWFYSQIKKNFKSHFIAFFATSLAFLNSSAIALEHSLTREPLTLFFLMISFYFIVSAFRGHHNLIYLFFSGVALLFCYYTRQEYFIFYFIIIVILFISYVLKKNLLPLRKKIIPVLIFSLPLFFVTFVMFFRIFFTPVTKDFRPEKIGSGYYSAVFQIASFALLPEAYDYNSPNYSSVIQRHRERVKQYKNKTGELCRWPPSSYGNLMDFYHYGTLLGTCGMEISNHKGFTAERLLDRVYLDIIFHNPRGYLLSIINTLKLYVLSEVNELNIFTISPYFNSEYNVPIKYSDLYKKPLLSLLRISHLPYLSKILFPFFIVGIVVGFKRRKELGPFFSWACIYAFTGLLVLSFVSNAETRFRYPIDPYIFLITAVGFDWFCKKLLVRSGTAIKLFVISLMSLFLIVGVFIVDKLVPIIFYTSGNSYYWYGRGPVTKLSTILDHFSGGIEKRKNITQTAINLKPEDTLPQFFHPLANSSFEFWNENGIPDKWAYAQTGKEGGLFREVSLENVKFGASSIKLVRSNIGVSQLYYTLSEEEAKKLQGKNIMLGGWVKSGNTVANKIYLSITDLGAQCYYPNTGKWEFIYFWYEVPKDVKWLNLYFNIDNDADADTYIDGVILAIQ